MKSVEIFRTWACDW